MKFLKYSVLSAYIRSFDIKEMKYPKRKEWISMAIRGVWSRITKNCLQQQVYPDHMISPHSFKRSVIEVNGAIRTIAFGWIAKFSPSIVFTYLHQPVVLLNQQQPPSRGSDPSISPLLSPFPLHWHSPIYSYHRLITHIQRGSRLNLQTRDNRLLGHLRLKPNRRSRIGLGGEQLYLLPTCQFPHRWTRWYGIMEDEDLHCRGSIR